MNEVARCIFLSHFFDEGCTYTPAHTRGSYRRPFCAPFFLLCLHIGIATYKALSL